MNDVNEALAEVERQLATFPRVILSRELFSILHSFWWNNTDKIGYRFMFDYDGESVVMSLSSARILTDKVKWIIANKIAEKLTQ